MPEFDGPSPEPKGGGFDLKKKVGPAPLWVWGLGGVAILALLFLRSKKGGGTPAVLPTATGAAGDANANGNPAGYDALSSQIVGLSGQLGTIEQQLAGSMGTTTSTNVTTPDSGKAGSLYSSFLGRSGAGDTAGVGYWNTQVAHNGLGAAFQQLELTPEAQNWAAANPSAFVTNEYQTLLNRTPSSSELNWWAGQVTSPNAAAAEAASFVGAAKKENPKL